jgi:hypothetical protein
MRVVNRIRELFGIVVPLHAFFRAPTLLDIRAYLCGYERFPGDIDKIAEVLAQVLAVR